MLSGGGISISALIGKGVAIGIGVGIGEDIEFTYGEAVAEGFGGSE